VGNGMANFDIARIGIVTNHVHQEILKAKGAQANGAYKEMIGHYRSAAVAACELMTEMTDEYVAGIDQALAAQSSNSRLREALRSPEIVRAFLAAEERLLKDIGLQPDLVDQIIDRCIDFTETDPKEWKPQDLIQAFRATKFRVCVTSLEMLEKMAPELESRFSARRVGRTALRGAVGASIIALNYSVLGPQELLFGLSAAYGGSWFSP
jgi:hypothetical protein